MTKNAVCNGFIINFQAPKELNDLADRFYRDGLTNINHILNFENTLQEWTVHKDAKVGDKVFFMCAKTSKDHMRRVTRQAEACGDEEIIDFARKNLRLYNRYAGKIVATGEIVGEPFTTDLSGYAHAAWKQNKYAKIGHFKLLEKPLDIKEFRDFIFVSRTGSVTKLSDEQITKLEKKLYE